MMPADVSIYVSNVLSESRIAYLLQSRKEGKELPISTTCDGARVNAKIACIVQQYLSCRVSLAIEAALIGSDLFR